MHLQEVSLGHIHISLAPRHQLPWNRKYCKNNIWTLKRSTGEKHLFACRGGEAAKYEQKT